MEVDAHRLGHVRRAQLLARADVPYLVNRLVGDVAASASIARPRSGPLFALIPFSFSHFVESSASSKSGKESIFLESGGSSCSIT